MKQRLSNENWYYEIDTVAHVYFEQFPHFIEFLILYRDQYRSKK